MIIISPWSRKLRNGVPNNPKDYPYWNELIESILKKYPKQNIVQVGVPGEKEFNKVTVMFGLPLDELKRLVKECDVWISVDNFFHHLASYIGKRGIVLFGQSDPLIFGDKNNINLLRDRSYLRPNHFDLWENAKFIPQAFVKPEKVLKEIKKLLP